MPDRISGQGPLGGLESCFRRAKTEKCLVLGVDTPLVPVEELQNLLKFAMEKADQPVTMLCHNGKEESLIAVYDARLYKVWHQMHPTISTEQSFRWMEGIS